MVPQTESTTEAGRLACDTILFVVTSSEETQLLTALRSLQIRYVKATHDRLGKYYNLGAIGSQRVIAVRTRLGPFGYGGSAGSAIYWTAGTGATSVILVGMAFGAYPKRQELGDVLVSTAIVPYDRKRVSTAPDSDILAGSRPYTIDYAVDGRYLSKQTLVERLMGRRTDDLGFNVFFGALLSGGAAIHSGDYRDELLYAVPDGDDPIVGGEMEGVGLLSISPADDRSWIIVKGICDFADANRDADVKRSRDRACRNSAQFVLESLS